LWKQILRPAREVRLTEADRVLTGKHRPPIACRDTNWQLGLDEVRLPSYESLRWFIRLRDCAANIFGWEQRDFVFAVQERPYPAGGSRASLHAAFGFRGHILTQPDFTTLYNSVDSSARIFPSLLLESHSPKSPLSLFVWAGYYPPSPRIAGGECR